MNKPSPQPRQQGRSLNSEGRASINLNLNEGQRLAINALLETGFYGGTAAACVMRLLDEKLIEKSKLQRP